MKNLGYMNGWSTKPEILIKCREQNHTIKSKEIGRCLNTYTCEICKYYYTVDSSD